MKFVLPIAFCLGAMFDTAQSPWMPPGAEVHRAAASLDKRGVPTRDENPLPPFDSATWTAAPMTAAEKAAAMETALHGAGMERYLALARVLPSCGADDLEKLYGAQVPGVAWRDMVFERWAEVDPKHILAIGKRFSCENRGSWALVRTNPQEALAQFPKMNSTEQGAMIRAMGQRDPAGAQNFLDGLPATEWKSSRHYAYDALEGLLQGMARDNPSVACAHAIQIKMPIGELVADWSVREPEAALAWAQGVPSNRQRALALQAIAGRALATDPAAAKLIIDQMPSGEPKAQMAAKYAAAMLTQDPNAIQTLLNDFTNPGEKATIIAYNTKELLEKAPATLIPLLEKMETVSIQATSDGPDVSAIFALSPKAAMNYAMATGSQTDVFEKWLDQAPEDASHWLVACPRGDKRDAIILEMNQSQTMRNDPEAAAQWMLDIDSPAIRDQAFLQVYRHWHVTDPDAAETFLSTNPKLTPAQRSAIRTNQTP